ncbi:MAG: HAD family hydrolase [Candidatus Marinimicrobia bacterium]|nr:HAD family hydrolase [Candidatus Neomarinimicrobiota bacterium]MDD5582427.1 HAD family hydrolase [Candidatus Neomarinimicrobiota bacterium]
MKIKALILDLDNTLMDFGHLKENSIRGAIMGMIEAGMTINEEDAFKEIMGIYEKKGWEYQKVLDEFIINHEGSLNYQYLAAGITHYRKAREAQLQPYPTVFSTLITLIKQGVKLAVVSDAPAREAWLRLYQLNLHRLFDVVVTFDDTGETKPSPNPFKLALQKLQLSPKDVIMVGDWPERDMVGAKKLGIISVFAKYGDLFNTIHSGADYEINRFDEILTIIKRIEDNND